MSACLVQDLDRLQLADETQLPLAVSAADGFGVQQLQPVGTCKPFDSNEGNPTEQAETIPARENLWTVPLAQAVVAS